MDTPFKMDELGVPIFLKETSNSILMGNLRLVSLENSYERNVSWDSFGDFYQWLCSYVMG